MICENCRTVFIHIPKTAGQSIERFFLHKAGLDWEHRESFLLRPKQQDEPGPPRLAHLRAEEYLRYGYMTPERFASYFTFSIVRNPWDRMVSFYYYLSYYKQMDFYHFIKEFYRIYRQEENYWFVRPQYEYLQNENGEISIDYIGRFEHLQESFDHICKKLQFAPEPLPKVNISPKKSDDTLQGYRHLYNSETRSIIEEVYHKDIACFDYRF